MRRQRGVKRCANPMRPQMSAVETVSSELPTFSEWAMPRLARQRGLEQPSDSRADVVLVETAEPQRVHGQRPWFQNSMNNYSSLVICQVQPFRASGPGLKRPLERLNKPVQMPAIHHPHACGGNARCTTCRVHFVAGEPERMTEAEKQVLAARGILGNAGVRLSCQILCDHEMTVYAIRRFAGSGRANVGNRPAEQITPPPTWINT